MSSLERTPIDLTGPGETLVDGPMDFELEGDEIDLSEGVLGVEPVTDTGPQRPG